MAEELVELATIPEHGILTVLGDVDRIRGSAVERNDVIRGIDIAGHRHGAWLGSIRVPP